MQQEDELVAYNSLKVVSKLEKNDSHNQQMLLAAEERFKQKQASMPTVQDTLAAFKAQLKEPWYLINPDGAMMQRWDAVTTVALVFTAIVTPFEVACLRPESSSTPFLELAKNPLWVANQIVNLVFVVDMGFSFFTIYRESAKKGSALVKDLKRIRQKYVKGWFAVDVVSIVPFGFIPGAESLGILRMLRIVRLLKLARVLRASRIYQRFQARNSMPHSAEGLFKLIFLLVVTSHWMACAWVMSANLQDAHVPTWMDVVAERFYCAASDEGGCDVYPSRLALPGAMSYYAALYWSLTTITSVGYGDITPQNTDEMLVCTIYLLTGSVIWAYIIGNAVTIISTGEPVEIQHHQTMDALNRYIAEKQLPDHLRVRLRRYFRTRKELTTQKSHQELLSKLSPMLTEDVCQASSSWLRKLHYLSDEEEISVGFLVTVMNHLVEFMYEPRESIKWKDTLCAISRGVCSVQGRICPVGFLWGEDFVLESEQLKDKRPAHALTYVTILRLDRNSFMKILQHFPQERSHIRKATVRLAVRRAVLAHACLHSTAEDTNFTDLMKQVVKNDAKVEFSPREAEEAVKSKREAQMFEDVTAQVKESEERTMAFVHEATASLTFKLDAILERLGGASAATNPLPSSGLEPSAPRPSLPSPGPEPSPSAPRPSLPLDAPLPLPDGWVMCFSSVYGTCYYHHAASNTSSWLRPTTPPGSA